MSDGITEKQRKRWKDIIISKEIIGNVHERYDALKRKKYDWSSFYNGWIEGRFAMIKEIKKE